MGHGEGLGEKGRLTPAGKGSPAEAGGIRGLGGSHLVQEALA